VVDLPSRILVAHNEQHADLLRSWFPGVEIIVNKPIPRANRQIPNNPATGQR
jgi:hypothetical protein